MKLLKYLTFISILIIVLVSCSPNLASEIPSWLKNEKWEKVEGNSGDYIFTTSDDILIAEYATFYYSLKEEIQSAKKSDIYSSDNSFSLYWESRTGTGVDMEGNVFSSSGAYNVTFTRLNAIEISFTYNRKFIKGDEITYVETSGIYRRG